MFLLDLATCFNFFLANWRDFEDGDFQACEIEKTAKEANQMLIYDILSNLKC